MGEATEGCRGSEAAMQLTAFSVGARRASCGKCPATKHGDARLGIEMQGRPPFQGRGYRDNAGTYGGLKSSPEFVKPWHSKQGRLSAFIYFSTRARDKKWMSKHHPARPEPPRPQGPRVEETTGTAEGPASTTWKKHLAIPILHHGARGERCASSTSVPGGPAARPLLRRLGGGVPSIPRFLTGAGPVPAARAHHLLRCPAPGCRRARAPRGPESWHPLLP